MTRKDEGRWGSREVEITGVTLKDGDGQAAHIFQSGEPMSIHLAVRAHETESPTLCLVSGLYSADGVNCYGTNTHLEEFTSRATSVAKAKSCSTIDSLDLVEGTYKLDVAVHKRDGYPYDYHRLLYPSA